MNFDDTHYDILSKQPEGVTFDANQVTTGDG
jgi:hypothetical protein